MTKQEIEKAYEIDYARMVPTIVSPGKFEGEPIFAPYFWQIGLEGFADSDNGRVYGFRFNFTTTDKDNPFKAELKAWLGRKRSLKLVEDDCGFVRCI